MESAIQDAPRSELVITGMSCANCARHVLEALQSVPGVDRADVLLDQGRANVRWKPGSPPNISSLSAAVTAAGYEAKPAVKESPARPAGNGWRLNVILGLACTLPIMAGEWLFGWQAQRWFQWMAFVLALVVQVFGGARFYRGAWRQIKLGASNMDTLVALGSTAAFGYSVWALLSGAAGELYFMESAAIITLISIGHWFRSSRHRAGRKVNACVVPIGSATGSPPRSGRNRGGCARSRICASPMPWCYATGAIGFRPTAR